MKHNNIALLLLSHKIEQIAVHKTNVDYDYNVKISSAYNEKNRLSHHSANFKNVQHTIHSVVQNYYENLQSFGLVCQLNI